MIEQLKEWDTSLFLALNNLHNSFFDIVMYYMSQTWIWIPLYLVVLFFIFRPNKKRGALILLFIVLSVLLADQISVHGFKDFFMRLRPSHNPAISVHIVNDYRGGTYGFVSSHAANTFAFATFVSLLFKNKKWNIFIFAWAFLVSYSRIYLGVHYPADIFCGALLGILMAWLSFSSYSTIATRLFSADKEENSINL